VLLLCIKYEREVRVMKEEILSSDYTKLVIETDEENPVIIAEITNEDVETYNGYRVRLTPSYN